MTFYALDPAVFERIEARLQSLDIVAPDEAFMRTVTGRVGRGEHMQIAGDVALVPIRGVLEKSPSIFSFLFGDFTAYGDIVQAINDANANSNVSAISLEIDSPGGNPDGIQAVVDAVRNSEKPIVAHVTDNAHSAAYWIASQAPGGIYVNNSGAEVGNIGVMTQRRVNDEIVTLTSTNAPHKFPDASTDDGRAKIVARLDEIHTRFATAVAEGRGVSVATVNSNFGQGRSVLAEAAVAAGMIDGIGMQQTSPAASEKAERKESAMDLQTLKAEHPGVYEAAKAEGFAEGQTAGQTAERDRVNALMTYGKECGAMDIAVKAIESGDSPTNNQTLIAKFLTAGRNKEDLETREKDNPGTVTETEAPDEDKAKKDALMPDVLDIDKAVKEMEAEND